MTKAAKTPTKIAAGTSMTNPSIMATNRIQNPAGGTPSTAAIGRSDQTGGGGVLVKATSLLVVAHVGQGALDGGGCRHCRAHQMGASTAALPALEVAVRG